MVAYKRQDIRPKDYTNKATLKTVLGFVRAHLTLLLANQNLNQNFQKN